MRIVFLCLINLFMCMYSADSSQSNFDTDLSKLFIAELDIRTLVNKRSCAADSERPSINLQIAIRLTFIGDYQSAIRYYLLAGKQDIDPQTRSLAMSKLQSLFIKISNDADNLYLNKSFEVARQLYELLAEQTFNKNLQTFAKEKLSELIQYKSAKKLNPSHRQRLTQYEDSDEEEISEMNLQRQSGTPKNRGASSTSLDQFGERSTSPIKAVSRGQSPASTSQLKSYHLRARPRSESVESYHPKTSSARNLPALENIEDEIQHPHMVKSKLHKLKKSESEPNNISARYMKRTTQESPQSPRLTPEPKLSDLVDVDKEVFLREDFIAEELSDTDRLELRELQKSLESENAREEKSKRRCVIL
ncbi:MAG: hypothetical protein P4L22_06860 [Candidatus Babeliales bacterium]|nr:hypothetical protein [Candidatus Babeliales bacterium]